MQLSASTFRRWFIATALVLGATFGFASPASAHAELEQSTPASGATLTVAPAQVDLAFEEGVEIKLSHITVTDQAGKRVDAGSLQRVNGDNKTLSTKLNNVGNSTYTVSWKNVSTDGHPESGTFTFVVAVPESASTPTTIATASVTSTTSAVTTTTAPEVTANSDSGSSTVGIVIGILATIAIWVIVALVIRKRKS
jgi:methionine-rich copper-binding protein CopC